MRHAAGLLFFAIAALAQPPKEATIEIRGSQAIARANSTRPVEALAEVIAAKFNVIVSVEDPLVRPESDIKDVTAEVSRVPNPAKRVRVPRGGKLEIQFPLKPNGTPADVPAMLQALATASNTLLPYAYEVRGDGEAFAIVPTKIRGKDGRMTAAEPLLDRNVTIPEGVRAILESANLMAQSLSSQTGAQVSCCQSGVVAGVPWGLRKIAFAAQNEPARRALRRLILAEYPNAFWQQRCDVDGTFCLIQARAIVQPERNPLR